MEIPASGFCESIDLRSGRRPGACRSRIGAARKTANRQRRAFAPIGERGLMFSAPGESVPRCARSGNFRIHPLPCGTPVAALVPCVCIPLAATPPPLAAQADQNTRPPALSWAEGLFDSGIIHRLLRRNQSKNSTLSSSPMASLT